MFVPGTTPSRAPGSTQPWEQSQSPTSLQHIPSGQNYAREGGAREQALCTEGDAQQYSWGKGDSDCEPLPVRSGPRSPSLGFLSPGNVSTGVINTSVKGMQIFLSRQASHRTEKSYKNIQTYIFFYPGIFHIFKKAISNHLTLGKNQKITDDVKITILCKIPVGETPNFPFKILITLSTFQKQRQFPLF